MCVISRKRKLQEEADTYMGSFNITAFLKMFPDPDETFSKIEKQLVFEDTANNDDDDVLYALKFLYNKYRFVRTHSINLLFKWKNKNLYQICEQLERLPRQLRVQRPRQQLGQTSNIPLLQLVSVKT